MESKKTKGKEISTGELAQFHFQLCSANLYFSITQVELWGSPFWRDVCVCSHFESHHTWQSHSIFEDAKLALGWGNHSSWYCHGFKARPRVPDQNSVSQAWYYSRDIPFWSGTLETSLLYSMRVTITVQLQFSACMHSTTQTPQWSWCSCLPQLLL